jgi:hypothetical protein
MNKKIFLKNLKLILQAQAKQQASTSFRAKRSNPDICFVFFLDCFGLTPRNDEQKNLISNNKTTLVAKDNTHILTLLAYCSLLLDCFASQFAMTTTKKCPAGIECW